MSAPLSPVPTDADVINTQNKLARQFYLWLYELWTRVASNVTHVGTTYSKANQTAAIVAANVYTVTQTGLYRVSYRMRVTTPASVSSSLTMTVGWREGAVTQSQAAAAVTGNTTTTQQNGTLFVRADSGTVITASVAYASVGTAMIYATDVIVELVS